MDDKKNAWVRPASLKAFGKALRQARVAAGMTLDSLAEATGISKPYLAHIETARALGPPSEGKLKALAKALGIEGRVLVAAADWLRTPASVRRAIVQAGVPRQAEHRRDADATPRRGDGAIDLDVLMGGRNHEDTKNTKTYEEEKNGGRGAGGKTDADTATYGDMIEVKRVPLINRVAAGKAGEFGDLSYPAGVADAYVVAPDLPEAEGGAAGAMFAVKVSGDSMLPEYREGDVIIVGPGEAKDGEDCVVRLGEGENFATTFKRVFFEREGEGEAVAVRLVPLNPAHAERRVLLEGVTGIYPMVYRLVPRRAPAAPGAKVKASEKLNG